MQHHISYRKLGRTTPHRLALFRNMVCALITRDRIETTLPKAKELRRVAEWMVTLGKKGTLAARRNAARTVQDDGALKKLFSVLAERFKDRNGGYTRIIRMGNRHGDAAPMAIIEYLGDNAQESPSEAGKKKPRAKRVRQPAKAKAQ